MKRSYFNKAKADADHQTNSAAFFIENGILSAGWSFKNTLEMRADAAEKIHNFNDYRAYFEETVAKLNWKKKWNNQGVHYLFDNLQAGDFVWIRDKGVYWVTEIPDDPKAMFKFDMSEKYIEYDAVAHIGPLKWVRVGTEEMVPGSVSTAKGRLKGAMQRIDNGDESAPFGNEWYTTTSLIGKLAINQEQHSPSLKTELSKSQIFNLMVASGLEDLLAMWLFDKYGFIVIPSTNKLSTELYEFVMIDGRSRTDKKIYVQTKNGKVDLYSDNYKGILRNGTHDEVWLLTRSGAIDGDDTSHFVKVTIDHVEKHSLDELIEFIFDKNNDAILPPLVKKWITKFDWR